MTNQRLFALSTVGVLSFALLAGCFHTGGTPAGDIKIGTLLPITGGLAAFGGDMQKAADLAAADINAAGGILGRNVKLVHGDSRTSSTEAPQEMNRLVDQEKVVAVVGAASSGVTLSVLPKAKSAGVPLVSPASTSPTLAKQDVTGGWFFRVPPSDALQGKVMAELLKERGRAVLVNSIYINNDYGKGFNDVMRSALPTGALGTAVSYDPAGSTFSSEVQSVCGTPAATAIVLIGYPDTAASIMKRAHEIGCAEEDDRWFFSEGVYDQKFIDDTGKDTDDAWILAGYEGTTPAFAVGSANADFKAAFKAKHNKDPGLFASETYEAIMWIALAIQKGGEAGGMKIKDSIRTIVNADSGDTNVTKVADALSNLKGGKGINWNGPAHNFDLDANNEPVHGIYAYWEVTDDGKLRTTKENIFV